MGVLVDWEIRERCVDWEKLRDLYTDITGPMVAPYFEDSLQPASYDVHLGSVFLEVDRAHLRPVDLSKPKSFQDLYSRREIADGQNYVLPAHGFALAHTVEYVNIPSDIVCRIEGRSSLARLGLIVESAGYVDPGFRGSLTMELANLLPVPIIMRPGHSIAQLSFEHTSQTPEKLYDGNYQDSKSVAGSRYGL